MHKTLHPTLAATALLLALPAVQAADLELFGFFDQGVAYVHEELNRGMASPAGQSAANVLNDKGLVADEATRSNVALGTGNVSTWGMKGSEKLNDDVSVVFHLESGFLADDGTIYGSGNQIFEREASLGIKSQRFGELKFGRMPALTTGSGTTGIFNSRVNPFGAGWGNMTGGWKFSGTLAQARWNNMVNYISPVMNGVKFHLQHSFGNANNATEGTHDADRWSAAGFTWTGEKFYLAGALDWIKTGATNTRTDKDVWKALLGGHVNLDPVKLYGTVQYLKNTPYIGGYSTKEFAPLAQGQKLSKGFEAWAFSTGVDVPAAGGTIKASVGYGFGENQNVDEKNKFSRVNAGLGYLYPLSKRTSVYGITGFFMQDADWQQDNITAHEVILGLMHRW